MKLDYSKAWDDARALVAGHKEAVLAIAGVFVFLPSLLFSQFGVAPDTAAISGASVTPDVMMAFYGKFFADNGLLLIVVLILSAIGSVALYVTMLRRNLTIGGALGAALVLLIPYLVMTLLSGFAAGVGFLLLIVPGIYLMVKFSQASTAMAAENIKNPITALGRSWKITKGNSLRIFGFLLIVGIVGLIAIVAISAVLGIPVNLLLPDEAAVFVNNVISALLGAAFSIVLVAVSCAIYRQLNGLFDKQELEETF